MYDDNDVIRKENYPENFYTLSLFLFAASCRSRLTSNAFCRCHNCVMWEQEWKTTNFFCFLIMNLLNSNFMIIFIFRSHTKRHTEAVARAKRARLLEIEIKGDNGKSRRGKKCVRWGIENDYKMVKAMTWRWNERGGDGWRAKDIELCLEIIHDSHWKNDDGSHEGECDMNEESHKSNTQTHWLVFRDFWLSTLASSHVFLLAPTSAVYERDWYA